VVGFGFFDFGRPLGFDGVDDSAFLLAIGCLSFAWLATLGIIPAIIAETIREFLEISKISIGSLLITQIVLDMLWVLGVNVTPDKQNGARKAGTSRTPKAR
jgi:hypothetical protein